METVRHNIEAFICTVELQRGPRTSSTCNYPVMWLGTLRKQSVSTKSWPVCRSSFEDRFWKKMCSSRSVTLVSCESNPLFPHLCCIRFQNYSIPSYNEQNIFNQKSDFFFYPRGLPHLPLAKNNTDCWGKSNFITRVMNE